MPSILPSLIPRERLRALPEGSAIYRLYRRGVCLYVGATTQLLTRMSSHHLQGHFDEIRYVPCLMENLYSRECAAMDIYAPTLNRRRGGYCAKRVHRWIEMRKKAPRSIRQLSYPLAIDRRRVPAPRPLEAA